MSKSVSTQKYDEKSRRRSAALRTNLLRRKKQKRERKEFENIHN